MPAPAPVQALLRVQSVTVIEAVFRILDPSAERCNRVILREISPFGSTDCRSRP